MNRIKFVLFVLLVSISQFSLATNGYFQIGYGPKSRALSGATTAQPQDSLAAAVNPAGMGLLPSGADISLEIFSPLRSGTSPLGKTESDSTVFVIPNFGYVRKMNNGSLGLSVYANGGMNTDYAANLAGSTVNLFGAPGELGVNLRQLIFAPSYARTQKRHTFGVSLLLAYQTFEAKGLSGFTGLTPPATAGNTGLTNQGEDNSAGIGIRIGWIGKFEKVQLGAAYASKIYMKEFDKYNELFAEQGDFDIPANWSVGIAYQLDKKITLLTDIQGIQYGDVAAIANPGPTTTGGNPLADGQGLLGQDNGLGFGWDNMVIIKLGALYQHNENMQFRLGLSHGEQPIDDTQVTFNILAPAVVQTHLSFGLSLQPKGKKLEYTFSYNHAFKNDATGDFPQAFGGTPGARETTLEMQQHTLEAGVSWKF